MGHRGSPAVSRPTVASRAQGAHCSRPGARACFLREAPADQQRPANRVAEDRDLSPRGFLPGQPVSPAPALTRRQPSPEPVAAASFDPQPVTPPPRFA